MAWFYPSVTNSRYFGWLVCMNLQFLKLGNNITLFMRYSFCKDFWVTFKNIKDNNVELSYCLLLFVSAIIPSQVLSLVDHHHFFLVPVLGYHFFFLMIFHFEDILRYSSSVMIFYSRNTSVLIVCKIVFVVKLYYVTQLFFMSTLVLDKISRIFILWIRSRINNSGITRIWQGFTFWTYYMCRSSFSCSNGNSSVDCLLRLI